MENLIKKNKKLSNEEKLYWLDLFKTMNESNQIKFIKILKKWKSLKKFNLDYLINYSE